MAGKFLSLEETARHLGVTVDEINRLVDRKQLFPIRDGAAVKFRLDDVDRVAADLGDDASGSGSLALDLDLDLPAASPASGPASAADDEIQLGDALDEPESIFGSGVDAPAAPSQTIVRGGNEQATADGGSALASSDLELDSIIGASAASLGGGSLAGGGDVVGSGPLSIDLSNLGSGSIVAAGSPGVAAPGSGIALSGPLDSGLSLEGGDLGDSGVELAGSLVASGIDVGGGSLVGDAFDLGGGAGDDESASVIIATEETGDSSFFGAVADDSSLMSAGDSSGVSAIVGDDMVGDMVPAGPPFSVLQIVGLVCCTLFLLACGLVMIDLVGTIRAPGGTPIASPLLEVMTELFAWQ